MQYKHSNKQNGDVFYLHCPTCTKNVRFSEKEKQKKNKKHKAPTPTRPNILIMKGRNRGLEIPLSTGLLVTMVKEKN